jgi:hypothetical protein
MKGDFKMSRIKKTTVILGSILALYAMAVSVVYANGGPFVLKYPNGDPAAKGVLARLDPDLKPATETRLRVLKEDLKVTFNKGIVNSITAPPLANVSAEYTIENPTNKEVEVDFGFPILRGVYVNPHSMMPAPAVTVTLDKKHIRCTIISNSAIYGIIRQRAREAIEKAMVDDPTLKGLVASIRNEEDETREAARRKLASYLKDDLKWNDRDAALMVEYASLDFGEMKTNPPDRSHMVWWGTDKELRALMNANLGPLAAIGEQKATQFFAQLASLFDSEAAAAYESIFTAWGGDVRERSVDLETGKVRPREVTVDIDALNESSHNPISDPTIYARVDYLDPKAKITESEKASCKMILKNLPVIFTFAPMNILHYRVKFPAKSTHVLTVSYSQYAYSDTRSPASYQLAYVVHPASLWQEFGPINIEVTVPDGVGFRASQNAGIKAGVVRKEFKRGGPDIYIGTLKDKTGEIYLAVDAVSWKKYVEKANSPVQRTAQLLTGARQAASLGKAKP